jgi:hypothetical protein
MSGKKSLYDELRKKRYDKKVFIYDEEPLEEQAIVRGGAIDVDHQKYNPKCPYGSVIKYYNDTHTEPTAKHIKKKIDKVSHYKKKHYK